jgi:hypothetical protein
MGIDSRSDKRDDVSLPVRLAEGGEGITRDLSASGVYFEMDSDEPIGSEVDLTIEFKLDKQVVLLKCHGQIMRVEKNGGRTGVAVKMLDSQLEMPV